MSPWVRRAPQTAPGILARMVTIEPTDPDAKLSLTVVSDFI